MDYAEGIDPKKLKMGFMEIAKNGMASFQEAQKKKDPYE